MQDRRRIHEDRAVLGSDRACLGQLSGVKGDRLFAEHVLAGGKRRTQIGDMRVMRRGYIDRVDIRVGVEVLKGAIDLLDPIRIGKCLGLGARAIGNARKLAACKRHRLRHLVGDHAAPDHRPTEFRGGKDVGGKALVRHRIECGIGCRGSVQSGHGVSLRRHDNPAHYNRLAPIKR